MASPGARGSARTSSAPEFGLVDPEPTRALTRAALWMVIYEALLQEGVVREGLASGDKGRPIGPASLGGKLRVQHNGSSLGSHPGGLSLEVLAQAQRARALGLPLTRGTSRCPGLVRLWTLRCHMQHTFPSQLCSRSPADRRRGEEWPVRVPPVYLWPHTRGT